MKLLSKRLLAAEDSSLSRKMFRKLVLFFLLFLLTACGNSQQIQPTQTETQTPIIQSTVTTIPSATSTPQPRLAPATYGPEAEDFPSNVNPLTGRQVEDPS